MQNKELSAGFDEENTTWEFVIKYTGDPEGLKAVWPRPVVFLFNQYAISRGTKEEIENLSGNPQVIWIEKPKMMEYGISDGIGASCIRPMPLSRGDLSGKGIVIAVIDSGIDIFHPDFINEDGTTRILGLWDQTGKGNPPPGYEGGVFYTENQINEAIRTALKKGINEARRMVPSLDVSGHGTHVAGIAAGNGRASGGRLKGAAYESYLLIIKLGSPLQSDFPRTTQVMTAMDFALRFALSNQMPLVINLSLGNNYGAHDGSTLLESYINEMMGLGRVTVVSGMGNQGAGQNHTSVVLKDGEQKEIAFIAGAGEKGFGLQIWKNYGDEFSVTLQHPSGKQLGPFLSGSGLTKVKYANTTILFYYGEPVPYSVNQELYITFLSEKERIDEGEWKIILIPSRIKSGNVEMWLPDAGLLGNSTGFLKPSPDNTVTIPATADKVISVGAYDSFTEQMAAFSGRGPKEWVKYFEKPDLVAPGVNIESCAPGGGYAVKSGTSMAVPFVAGSAAILMEWGIVKGNDPYLYGEKVKACLRKGAQFLPGYDTYPNSIAGYGKLCLRDSFPDRTG